MEEMEVHHLELEEAEVEQEEEEHHNHLMVLEDKVEQVKM
jgi:hypothetical protein